MNILICHERFLFRFGADRVLILLGKGLRDLGHNVSIMANRYDAEVVGSFASQVINSPVGGAPYIDLNEFTDDWLRSNWAQLFSAGNRPDVVIVGGWPYISAITFFREVCEQVIFVDFGVVPTYGYPEGTVITLEKLRALRKQHLGNASLIAGISRFIAESQSRPDSSNSVPVRSVLLGADHMEMAVWPAAKVKQGPPSGSALNLTRSLRLQGKKVLLCLGRWEPGCYKNSQAALQVMEELIAADPSCRLLVLEEPAKVDVPVHLKNVILPIGFPDDQGLFQIMKQCDLGLSFSLWEGFNLPLAEMQWLGRPALVFDVGAHPEVIAHPWYMCRDAAEMAVKAGDLLNGRGPDTHALAEALEGFRRKFRWERFTGEYSEILNEMIRQPEATPGNFPALFMDVTSATRDPANAGVIRVTRRLGRELQRYGVDPVFVVWEQNTGRYVLPTEAEYELLSRFNGPILLDMDRLSTSAAERTSLDDILSIYVTAERWLFLPEVMMETSFRGIRRFARERSLKLAAIFYDSIPVLRPDLCNEQIGRNHGQYMLGLAECDLAVPISRFSATCLEEFWRTSKVTSACRVVADVLPGEFGGPRRNEILESSKPDGVHILCVSTLEPRKNHRNLIQAFLLMTEQHPELDWRLTLVGNRYVGAFEIAEWIEKTAAQNPRIKWLGVVDDTMLSRLYEECAFTIYPSVIEGFGLPILESIWHGRPCICYNQGVMAELAAGGGCLTTDVTEPAKLGEAIYELATSDSLRLKQSREAIARALKTWNEYVMELTAALIGYSQMAPSEAAAPNEKMANDGSFSTSWQTALYADCLCDNWQMNDSERMALIGVLARHKPSCSIEVGTYCGGSLSLISQYSKMVFSIDIDASIPTRFKFPNVSFLTGRSTVILPYLLSELDRAGTPVEFILVDGDHSEAGVMADIACLLAYIPKKPLFALLHDSFNPECRKGILNAGWARSPYCHWVDIDFVPGRIVEHPGSFHGELWGGLAAAYFLPTPRSGEIEIKRTANGMFQFLSAARAIPAGACS
jgi:glycosyltransferase involved in cell wall biosynthesis/cephalosporin hydroxylase